jgi:hypothetical protein
MPTRDIHTIKRNYEKKLMKISGVVGVGIGKEDDEEVIVVLTAQLSPKAAKKIPDQLDGFKIAIRESGAINAL